jgi:2-C-methyl-D-erythritol 4-phosphate cytidylyltransferase
MKATVLIPAAGMGRRMGTAVSKQYLDLAGKPILAHTLSLFEHHPQIESIYLIVPPADIAYCREQIVGCYGFRKVANIVAGGAERQDSVFNGLQAMAADGIDQPHRPVLIHDGARPLFNSGLLSQLVEIIIAQGACAVGVPVKDTIKDVQNRQITGSPDRDHLWQAQTPQGAQYGLLIRAYKQAGEDGFRGTDDAALLTRLGCPVQMLESDYRNIKVTTPEDLLIAAALLGSSEKGKT